MSTVSLQQLQQASQRSKEIIEGFRTKLAGTPDAVEARVAELQAMKKDELIALIVNLEAPKNQKAFKVEDVARALLEDEQCALFNYEQIAALVAQVLPDGKTSSKSIGSYASKHKGDWNIVQRKRMNLDPTELLAIGQN